MFRVCIKSGFFVFASPRQGLGKEMARTSQAQASCLSLPSVWCLTLEKVDTKVNKMIKEEKTKRKRSFFRIPEELKLKVAKDRLLEGKSAVEISKEYELSLTSIRRILCNFAASNDKSALFMKNKPTDSQADEIKALREEVLELKKKLYNETMRADFYDTMIDVAEEMFNIEIRKKAGTGQSKGCTKTK